MTITLERPDLGALTDDELAELYRSGGDVLQAEILHVMSERDRRARVAARARQARRNDPVAGEWHDDAIAQFRAAEAELSGNLVSRAGVAAGVTDAFELWRGPLVTALSHATEELRCWWSDPEHPEHRRITVMAYRDQRDKHLAAERDDYEREAWTDDNALDSDVRNRVRRDDSAERQSAPVRGVGTGNPVPPPAARAEAQGRHAARADGRAGAIGPVRRGGNMTEADTRPAKSAAGMAIRARLYGPEAEPESAPVPAAYRSPAAAQVAVTERSAMTYAPAEEPAEPVDGAVVLRAIRVCLGYMALWPSEEALIAATCFVAQSHARTIRADLGDQFAGFALPVWQYAPRFFLTSSTGGSGKSWMARLMALLCADGKSLIEPTKASLIDLIADQCTVVITELDRLLGTTGGRNGGIVAVANAGYEPQHLHTRMKNRKAEQIPLFGPMILDGLDSLLKWQDLQTLFSRAVIAHVRKGPAGYKPPRLDSAALAQFTQVRDLAAQWMAQGVAAGIGDYVPELPAGVGNRAAAIAEPLFAVAQWAGAEWPTLMAGAWARIESANGLPPAQAEQQVKASTTLAAWAQAQGMEWNAGTEGSTEGDDWA
jgi:hypothetical protein